MTVPAPKSAAPASFKPTAEEAAAIAAILARAARIRRWLAAVEEAGGLASPAGPPLPLPAPHPTMRGAARTVPAEDTP